MLPLIVQHSEALINFVLALHLALFQPQIRHLLEIVDALIICNQRKTLSGLARLLHRSVDSKALADFFRESPWRVDLLNQPRKKFMLAKILELAQAAGLPLKILVSLDDSLGFPTSGGGRPPPQPQRKRPPAFLLEQRVCVRGTACPDRSLRLPV